MQQDTPHRFRTVGALLGPEATPPARLCRVVVWGWFHGCHIQAALVVGWVVLVWGWFVVFVGVNSGCVASLSVVLV